LFGPHFLKSCEAGWSTLPLLNTRQAGVDDLGSTRGKPVLTTLAQHAASRC